MNPILSIDPGQAGGAVIHGEDGPVWWLQREKVDDLELADTICAKIMEHGIISAVIERAQAFPGQGATSVFTYGDGYGFWRGLLVANNIGFETIRPLAWQKGLGIAKVKGAGTSKPDHKKHLMAEARRRWPKLPNHSGICDAALLACYSLRVINGGGSCPR